MNKTIISASQIKQAHERADEITDDWQAHMLEIALIPEIHQIWREQNNLDAKIERHNGTRPFIGHTSEDNRKIGKQRKWHLYNGYYVRLAKGVYWNQPSDVSYSHSAARAWDGIRRETCHNFIDTLSNLYMHHNQNQCMMTTKYLDDCEALLWAYGIEFMNDLEEEENGEEIQE